MNGRRAPDQLEKRVRFGCGFIAGAVFGFAVTLFALPYTLRVPLAIGAVAAIVFGVMATRYGDRFWYGLRHLFWFGP